MTTLHNRPTASPLLLGEYDGYSGAPLREYVWLQGMPVAVAVVEGPAVNPTVTYLNTDHIDTTRVAVDRQGRPPDGQLLPVRATSVPGQAGTIPR